MRREAGPWGPAGRSLRKRETRLGVEDTRRSAVAAVSRAPAPTAGRPESGGQRGGGEPAGKASFRPGFTKAGLAARLIRPVFWFWYAAGLLLMLFYKVPEMLGFSNGLFLLFFASYAVFLETRTGRGIPGIVFRTTLVAAVTFGVEAMGVATGFPFGSYAYTHVLGIAAGVSRSP
ncbi:carotenoid biosynthesis protein [Paenibacillus sp. CC-CFT747]|nr:carotenoid biosynthesis protein [Paenibacillus sp. CC-CFT747]